MTNRLKFCTIAFLWLVLGCLVVPAHSATKYVTDDIEVMVRTGPGTDHKILATPRSGTPVEILEESPSGWFRVRLPNNKEGWMVGRYLNEGPPAKEVIAELKKENDTLKQRIEVLNQENARMKQERDDLQGALAEQTKTAEGLRESYETLREKDPELLALKDSHKMASENLTKSTVREAELEQKLKEAESGQYFKWFLAGAGVLLLGFLIGSRTRRAKRRPSLL